MATVRGFFFIFFGGFVASSRWRDGGFSYLANEAFKHHLSHHQPYIHFIYAFFWTVRFMKYIYLPFVLTV